MKLFQTLVEKQMIKEWACHLDWILSTSFFENKEIWSKGSVSTFTKKLKCLLECKDKSFVHKGNPSFPDVKDKRRRPKNPVIIMSSTESEGRDFLRHLRNGIAHGSASIYNVSTGLFLEITDYKDDTHKKQTAYFAIKADSFLRITALYKEIEKTRRSKLKR